MPISYKTTQEYIEFRNKTAQEYTVNFHCMAKKHIKSCLLRKRKENRIGEGEARASNSPYVFSREEEGRFKSKYGQTLIFD